MAKIILDTNILVYLYDSKEVVKHSLAANLLSQLQQRQSACLPVQVLSEFMNLSRRRLSITPSDAYAHVSVLSQSWEIIPLTSAIVLEAARGVRDYQLAYYDAQIWATARLNQIPVIFSEDFNNGAILEGIHFVNPFLPTFQLSDWV